MYTKKLSNLIWTIPVNFDSESTIFEIQFYNLSKILTNWSIKYNKCIKCAIENKSNKTQNLSNKCIHYKNIQIFPSQDLKVI